MKFTHIHPLKRITKSLQEKKFAEKFAGLNKSATFASQSGNNGC